MTAAPPGGIPPVRAQAVTTRRLMAVVLLVAVALAAVLGALRWADRVRREQFHAAQAEGFMTEAAEAFQRAADEALEGRPGPARAQYREALRYYDLAIYHISLRTKYTRATRRPWESVAPDGPPP